MKMQNLEERRPSTLVPGSGAVSSAGAMTIRLSMAQSGVSSEGKNVLAREGKPRLPDPASIYLTNRR